MGRTLTLVVLAGCWRGSPAPIEPVKPTVVGVSTMEEVVGRIDTRPGDLIDPALGLVFLDRYLEPGEPPGTMSERHLCGAELAKFLRDDYRREVGRAASRALAEGELACNERELVCRFGGRSEWDAVHHFTFARTRGRLVLRAIAYDDEVLVGDDTIRAEHAKQAELIAKLSGPCSTRAN